ncbi:MAG: hypothetical protein AB1778_06670 [Candidatus Bipolaricaulota bacterium]
MTRQRFGYTFLAAALLAAGMALTLWAQPAVRLVEEPPQQGIVVLADSFEWEDSALASMRLGILNDTTNVLTIDLARSFLSAKGGEPVPLSLLAASDFSPTLLPSKEGSLTTRVLGSFGPGDRIELSLVWTLGADVDAATWAWEIVAAPDVTPTEVSSEQLTAEPLPPAEVQPTPEETELGETDAGPSDVVLGFVGLAVGLALLALVVLALWGLATPS